ncbi:MAG: PHP domain-containing protein [Clostridia bacterium]|nr:PHP domain-containing protein [Clostridia bacterium]
MKYKIDHDYHIHSLLSSCSRDAEQTAERILQYAKDNSLSRICITDHYWDSAVEGASKWYEPQNFEHISRALPLPQADGIEFLFGCETDMDMHRTIGIPPERYDDFDFIIIPTTHLHMKCNVAEADRESNKRRAELWVERLEGLLSEELPFGKIGIAHLACGLINNRSREDYLETLGMIPDGDMERLFAKAAERGCGIELNMSDMSFADSEAETVLRPFRIAKSCGCKFYLGSDAHHPASFDKAKAVFERAIDRLELSEDDKFHIVGK